MIIDCGIILKGGLVGLLFILQSSLHTDNVLTHNIITEFIESSGDKTHKIATSASWNVLAIKMLLLPVI